MEQDGTTGVVIRNRNYNIKPAQIVDTQVVKEDIDFPEFEFPVNDGGVVLDVWKAVSTAGQGLAVQAGNGNGNGTWGFLQPKGGVEDESPKALPLAFRCKEADTVLESNPFFPSLVTEPATKHCLSPLATFKNLDLSHVNGKVDVIENSSSDSAAAPSTPRRKSSSISSKVASGLAVVPSTPIGQGSSINSKVTKSQADSAQTLDRMRPKAFSASAPSRKISGGARSNLTSPSRREEHVRALSPTPDRRSFTSPRRLVPERSRSPVPFQKQDRGNVAVIRSLSPVLTSPRGLTPTKRPSTPRSKSHVPHSQHDRKSELPRDQRLENSVRSSSMPNSPRYVTPTRAASLKAVDSPLTPNASLSKELQFPTATKNATPIRDSVKRSPKEVNAKVSDKDPSILKVRTSPPLTQPTGFNFKTDERSEKRRDFYSKLEEKTRLKEEEKKQLEAKAQEEKELQLRELRKISTYKANPVPKFYQEPPPPPVEFKKSPPTRAKSPNFTVPRRRDSCMGSLSCEPSSTGSSPLRSRMVRSPSLERNCNHPKVAPKVKQPFKPI